MKSRIRVWSEAEHKSLMESLLDKAKKGQRLTLLELEVFCTRLTRESRANFPICSEYRFRDYYFSALPHRPVPERLRLSDAQKDELDEFAREWNDEVILVTNHKSQTLQHIAKEARKEIKKMSREFMANGYLVKSHLYYAKLKRVLWMSRFIHFKIVHEYFLGHPDTVISIPTKFGEVLFDHVSLGHIYTRHYAAGEKQYDPDQSFFSDYVHFNSIHRLVQLVLGRITQNNIHIAQPLNKAITFRYKSEYYQLYFDQVYIQRKGQGNIQVLRVKSIFPVNDPRILEKIPDLVEHVISPHLSIFEQ